VEFPFDPPQWTPERRDFILPAAILPGGDGAIALPDRPGLGVEIDWQALEPLRIHTGTME
jgi:L-alanine-DL-glutamate epimerase-like enolase superfamily enzyme